MHCLQVFGQQWPLPLHELCHCLLVAVLLPLYAPTSSANRHVEHRLIEHYLLLRICVLVSLPRSNRVQHLLLMAAELTFTLLCNARALHLLQRRTTSLLLRACEKEHRCNTLLHGRLQFMMYCFRCSTLHIATQAASNPTGWLTGFRQVGCQQDILMPGSPLTAGFWGAEWPGSSQALHLQLTLPLVLVVLGHVETQLSALVSFSQAAYRRNSISARSSPGRTM